jgi:hypothetical protein
MGRGSKLADGVDCEVREIHRLVRSGVQSLDSVDFRSRIEEVHIEDMELRLHLEFTCDSPDLQHQVHLHMDIRFIRLIYRFGRVLSDPLKHSIQLCPEVSLLCRQRGRLLHLNCGGLGALDVAVTVHGYLYI